MPSESHLLPAGKLPLPLLERLLTRFVPHDPRIIVGPRTGEDAAVLDFGDRYLVAKTDPITFATNQIGWYAVNVNANDIAVMGGEPRWFLATVLLPAGQATAELAEAIFTQIHDACEALGVSLAGGHTEITLNLDRPIVSGTMLGEVMPRRLITTAGRANRRRGAAREACTHRGDGADRARNARVCSRRGYSPAFIAAAGLPA